MRFEKFVPFPLGYSPSTKAPSPLSDLGILPGSYDDGIVTIFTEHCASTLLDQWAAVFSTTSLMTPLLYTGFGDVFIYFESSVFYLDTQRAYLEFVDQEIQWVLDEFLGKPEILDAVLRKSEFEGLVRDQSALTPGQVFILQPWEMLGGTRSSKHYQKGDFQTYFSMVGQALAAGGHE